MCSEDRSGSTTYEKKLKKSHLGWVNERKKNWGNLAPKNLTYNKGKAPYTYVFLRRNPEATSPIMKTGGVRPVFVSLLISFFSFALRTFFPTWRNNCSTTWYHSTTHHWYIRAAKFYSLFMNEVDTDNNIYQYVR